MEAAQSRAPSAECSNQIDGLAGGRDATGTCGGTGFHKSHQTGHHGRESSMVNEDDILLVSGGFSMDASQNSLAEHVSHMVDGSDQPDGCSQLDSASMDPRMRIGKATHPNGNAHNHPQHAHLSAQNEPANDTEPVSNQPFVPALPTSSLHAHAQPFAPPTPYAPESGSAASTQPLMHGRHSRTNSYGSNSVGGGPSAEPSGSSGGMQRMGSSQITESMNESNAATAAAVAGNGQVPFGTIDENQPTGSSVGGESGVDAGGLSFSGGIGPSHSRGASGGGGLSARGASISFGNLAMEAHNHPERDYSTELLLRDAMYPATHTSMFPSLKLPELSMDAAGHAYSGGPGQSGGDMSWSNQAMQAQAQSHQMAGLMQAGQLGGQMAGYSAMAPGPATHFAPGIGNPDSGRLDYAGSNAESSAAAGGSSFFERAYAQNPRQEAALRGWHASSTPAMLGMEGSHGAHIGAAISPRHLQTGPAWDQMPGMWRNDGFSGAPGGGPAGAFEGGGRNLMQQGGMPGNSYGGVLDNIDTNGNLVRDGGSGMPSGNPNIWLRGGSHPQLSTLGRGSGSGGYGGVGSMPKGGGGSFGGDLWKQRTNSSISLSQLQRATAAAAGATSAAAAHAAGSASGSSGSRAPSEHPLGEYPSRTLFTRNINIHTTDEELLTIFSQCGEVRSMYTSCKHRGFVMISYYDIRASTRAKQVLQGFMLRQRALDIHYSVPKENAAEPDLNQGTLVVFNMDSSIPRNQILDLFSQFGEVKEIRATPKKEGHKFVEFYDSRHAHAALQGLNRVIVAGRQLKIELSRPGGVRRARNSQQNLVALHSEHSSSHNDLLAASSMGSGQQGDGVPLAHSLSNALGPGGAGGLIGGGGSGGSNGGGAGGAAPGGGMHAPGSNAGSLQGSTEIQAMFQNLMLQAANPSQGGNQGQGQQQQNTQGGYGGGLSGPGGDSFQTPPDTPAAEGSLQDAGCGGGGFMQPGPSMGGQGPRHMGGQGVAGASGMGNMNAGGGGGQMGGDSGGILPQSQSASQAIGMGVAAPRSTHTHSNGPSVTHSPAGDESYAATRRAWGNAVNAGGAPGAGAGTSYGNMPSFIPGGYSADQGHSSMGMGPGGGMHGAGAGGMHFPPGMAQHHIPPQNLSPSDSATSVHTFYNALIRQFVANPNNTNTSPEAMEGSYQSMISELLQGSGSNPAAAAAAQAAVAGFQQPPPSTGMPPKTDQSRMYSTPPPHPNAPPFHPSERMAQHDQQQHASTAHPQGGGPPHPLHNSMTSSGSGATGGGGGGGGTLPATLAAAAASAAAALARDPSIPPEEHEARLHQHLMEQLSHMHRHAVGQNLMMEQYSKAQTPPPASPEHPPPPHHSPPHIPTGPHHHTPPHPPGSIGSPHHGSPHRSPHSSLPHSPRGPHPHPRGPHPLSMSHFTPSPPPAPPSVESDLNSPGRGGPGSCGSSQLRPMSPGGGLSVAATNSHGRYGHGSSTPRPISARHSRSPLAGGHSNASSLPASVAGSYNSVGEYLDGGGGSRRASHSGEHFILTPEAVGVAPGMDSRTTLMIRNIPNKYTQKILMQTIDAQGFYGKYDFFYLPIDFKNRCNVGYAFINMASTDAVRDIHEEFHNKGWERFNSEKRCCVAYARIQTRRALISHFQNSSLMHEDKRCRPVLLNLAGPSPETEEFPPPRRASHSSHSRRGGGRSGRRESMDSQAATSHRGSEPPTAPGTGNNTPRLSQEFIPFGGTAGRATS